MLNRSRGSGGIKDMSDNKELKKGLSTALEMERRGCDVYKKCAKKTQNRMTKKVFEALAEDENRHIGAISCYCAGLADRNMTPKLCDTMIPHKSIKDRLVFGRQPSSMEKAVKKDSNELKAYEIAMKMENDGYDFYKKSFDAAVDPNAKDLYKFLMEEEKAHFELISSSYDFLKNPAGWYIRDEKPIVEG